MSGQKIILNFFFLFVCVAICNSQTPSPYKTSLLKDGVWIGTTTGLNLYGLMRIKNKKPLSESDLATINADNIWFVDRFAAGNYDENAYAISDYPFIGSFAVPFLLVLGDDTRAHSGQLSVLMIESLSTASALFTVSAGVINKSRPKVYNEDISVEERISKNAQRSFFSGHVAASAAATFFTAQVFSDFYPNSTAKVFVWAGAATIPAAVGYFRIKAGEHFLSDVIVGYVVGAASGILVPTLHKKKDRKLNVTTGVGFNYQTIGVNYTF